MHQRDVAVFDVDGVLADVSARVHLVTERPKNWKAFFAAAPNDPVLPAGFELLREHAADEDIEFVTGRPEQCRPDTLRWLAAGLRRYGVVLPQLTVHMRGRGDNRRSAVAKLDLLLGRSAELAVCGRRIAVVVDDDLSVVQAYRGAGFEVVHATWAQEHTALVQAQQVDGRV